MKISDFTIDELRYDLAETLAYIRRCELALKAGVEVYEGGRVRDRLANNRAILATINAELERRGVEA